MAAPQLVHPDGQKPSSPGPGSAYFLPRSPCTLLASAFLSLFLFHLLFCSSLHGAQQPTVIAPLLHFSNHTYSSFSSRVGGEDAGLGERCDYSVGEWVWAPGHPPRYNGTECHVKDGQNCIRNGRPDTGYLHWRWQPAGCSLPSFDASAFLSEVRGKHVAFVGDSMARNQAESLLCLLSAASPYRRVVASQLHVDDDHLRRWAFTTHDVIVSVYWAPFLVRASGNYTIPYEILHLDALADRWSADADTMDVVVISVGHWFWRRAVYYNGGEVVGTHMYKELNRTEIGMFGPFREAYRMSLERLSSGRPRTVVAATLSPNHVEHRPSDDPTACAPKGNPYKEGEKELGSIDKELNSIVYQEMAEAAASTKSSGVRFEVMDVTKLAWLRPDGHPGPYMRRDPFANGGVPEKMPTDCLHFCLPGPVDTFNDILLQILMNKRRCSS